MRCHHLMLAVTILAAPLAALEEGQTLQRFLMHIPTSKFATQDEFERHMAILAISHPDRMRPLFLVGQPQPGGFFTLVRPESQRDLAMAIESGEAADLLGFGEVSGEGTIPFTIYSGGPPEDLQVGMPMLKEQPPWTVHIEECTESSFIGVDPAFFPDIFSPPDPGDYDRRSGTRKAPNTFLFHLRIRGHVMIGDTRLHIDAPARMKIHQSEQQGEGEPSAELQVVFDFTVRGEDLGQPELSGGATARCYLVCKNDVGEGSEEMRDVGPKKIDLDDDDIADDLGL